MRIVDYVMSKPKMPMSKWIETLEKDKIEKHRDLVISCAEHYDRILIVEGGIKELFTKTVNI
jgi:hypothetical protein